jgi:hypothetical protein
MPFLPSPLLPSAADLALRAALLTTPAVLTVIGHDLVIHSAAGQLLPLVGLVPGTHLLDRPIPKPARQTVLHHVIRALYPGEPSTYEVEAHGRRWRTTLQPIPNPLETDRTRQVLGVLRISVLADDDVIDCYEATEDVGDIHAGDVLTCLRSGVVCRTEAIAQRVFDRALALGRLRQTSPAADSAGASPRRGVRGGPPLRLLRA